MLVYLRRRYSEYGRLQNKVFRDFVRTGELKIGSYDYQYLTDRTFGT